MTRLASPAACATHAGRRATNQDAVLATLLPDGRELVAVADGMGGHAAGEVASATALETLHGALRLGVELGEAVRAANLAIFARASGDEGLAGMGTTLVAMLRQDEQYWVANVGDSRAYRVTATGVEPLTRDHSFHAEALQAGMLSLADVERSPWRHALTRSLGNEPELEVDVFGPFPARGEPHILVLCSDGLYRGLGEAELHAVLLSTPNVGSAAAALPELAMQHGSDDNITVALREYGQVPRHANGRPRSEAAAPEPPRSGPTPEPQPAPAIGPAAAALPAARIVPTRSPRGSRRRRKRFSFELAAFLLCTLALAGLVAWYLLNLDVR